MMRCDCVKGVVRLIIYFEVFDYCHFSRSVKEYHIVLAAAACFCSLQGAQVNQSHTNRLILKVRHVLKKEQKPVMHTSCTLALYL